MIQGLSTRPRGIHPLLLLINEPLSRKENECLYAIEGGDKYGLEAVDLCLVLDVGLPIDFKTPDLTGAALSWYVSLERGRIKTWGDLAEAFLKQYKSTATLEHDQERTRRIQRICPKMKRIGGTSSTPNYKEGNGERIELGIRRGKFTQTSTNASCTKKAALERKKCAKRGAAYSTQIQGGSRSTTTQPTPYIPPSQPQADTSIVANARLAQQGARRAHRVLTPIPMTYTKLFPLLLEQKLIEVVPLKPLEPPYLRNYDPKARCDYHGEAIGHATKRYNGLLGFKDKEPNVHNNPFPAHGTMAVNAIDHVDKRITSPSGECREAMVSTYQVEEESYLG
ncbi:hypothetical protein CR513_13996, partial [Mucuna pruriens]